MRNKSRKLAEIKVLIEQVTGRWKKKTNQISIMYAIYYWGLLTCFR